MPSGIAPTATPASAWRGATMRPTSSRPTHRRRTAAKPIAARAIRPRRSAATAIARPASPQRATCGAPCSTMRSRSGWSSMGAPRGRTW